MSAATLTADKFEAAAEILSLSQDFKVLRRFYPRERYYIGPWPDTAVRGAFVDVETTGLDRQTDEIIELGIVGFWFDKARDQILSVDPDRQFSGFEEPKGEVSAEITKITGILPEDLIGQKFDDALINGILAGCDLIVAHNAEFDRQLLERRFPVFRDKYWACSQHEVEWPPYGAVGAKLGNILNHVCGEFYDAHRALDDCRVGVHVLAHQRSCDECGGTGEVDGGYSDDPKTVPCDRCVDGMRSPFSDLMASMRSPLIRINAIDAPFPKKDALKARGYKWNNGERVEPKAWYIDVKSPADRDEELMYLRDIIGVHAPEVVKISAKDRYSARVA